MTRLASRRIAATSLGLLAALLAGFGHADETVARKRAVAERLFTLKVLPLLKVKCFGCHGGDPKDIRGQSTC